MRLYLAVVFLFIFSNKASSQNLNFVLVDEVDYSSVQFATACYKKSTNLCTFSDSTGRLVCKKLDDDSLVVSRIGYETKVIFTNDLVNIDTLFLKKNIEVLPTVYLTNNISDDSKIIGNNKKENGFICLIPNLELGRTFELPNEKSKLKSVSIYINAPNQSVHLFQLTVSVFSKKEQKPTDEKFKQLYKLVPRITSNKFVFELEDPICVGKNIFISLKYLGSQSSVDKIELTTSNRWKDTFSFERYFSSEWKSGPNVYFLKNKFRGGLNNILMQIEIEK